jgi:chemotaxis regulatin CheY-phosphate phosphatase CheZ
MNGEAQRLSTLPSKTDASACQERRDNTDLLSALRDRLTACQELLPELTDQLRLAVQKTEQAVLEISENFMNVAGRARRQLQAATDIVGSLANDQRAASGSDAGRTAKAAKLDAALKGLSAETEMLGRDINGIITSLQFQDITRQEIEKVIGRIAQFQQELMDMKRGLGPESASAPGPVGPCPGVVEVNRREHA